MKRLLSLALGALLLFGPLALTACNKNGGDANASKGLTFELNGQRTGYIVTGMGSCTDTRVVIPSTYQGLPVTSIAKGAFQAAVPPVKENPSNNNDKDKDKDKDKKSVLATGPVLLSVFESAPDAEKPEANISEIVIPDSVMDIGDEAFYGCEELASFEVSNLIALIGTDAFKNTAFYLDEANWKDDSLYLEEYLIEVRPSVSGAYTVREGTVNIADNAFRDCTAITAVSFPSSLRFVGNSAFLGCTGITEADLTIPGIQIGDYAFQNCTALTTVKIATNDTPNAPPVKSILGAGYDRVDEVFMPGGFMNFAFDPTADPNLIYSSAIGYSAFSGCTALRTVLLGSNVGFLGGRIFENCTSLVSVDLSMITANDPKIPVVTPAFNYCFPMSLSGLFQNCTALTQVTLPQGIEWLHGTFEGCTALTEFTVPNTVKGLNGTFARCAGLTDVTIPESVIAIAGTFDGCTALSEIELPETLVRIGARTFQGCHALSGVYVPDSVTEIGERVFPVFEWGDFYVSFGKGVQSIGREAVYNENVVIYRGTMAEWKKIALHESWNGGEGYDKHGNKIYADIVCTDGTIVSGGTFTESMQGLLLSDGTLYAKFLGVTVTKKPNGGMQISALDLAQIEAEQQGSATASSRLNAIDMAQIDISGERTAYADIAMIVKGYLENGSQQSGGGAPSHEKPIK